MHLKLGNLYSSSVNPVEDKRHGNIVALYPEKTNYYKYEVWSATAREQLQDAADKILINTDRAPLQRDTLGDYLALQTQKFGLCHIYGITNILQNQNCEEQDKSC